MPITKATAGSGMTHIILRDKKESTIGLRLMECMLRMEDAMRRISQSSTNSGTTEYMSKSLPMTITDMATKNLRASFWTCNLEISMISGTPMYATGTEIIVFNCGEKVFNPLTII